MSTVRNLIFILGDQLTWSLSSLEAADPGRDIILMCEVIEEATYAHHHKLKMALIFSAMRHFAIELREKGFDVRYVQLDDLDNTGSFTGELDRTVAAISPKRIIVTEASEWRVLQAMKPWKSAFGLPVEIRPDTRFLVSKQDFQTWTQSRRALTMEYFYRDMRRRTGLLMNGKDPEGGRWNFDADNRKPAQADLFRPTHPRFPPDAVTRDVLDLVERTFPRNMGSTAQFSFAVTRSDAQKAADAFVRDFLPDFGKTQDAMLKEEPFLNHALLSFYINIGLLDPLEICRMAERAYREGHAPLNSVEGLIRQIIGWREYIRGIYWLKMPGYENSNIFDAKRPLPDFFWTGETDMACVSSVIKQTMKGAFTGWMAATIAAVLLLVQAGTLLQLVMGWITSSLLLHKLLLFYPQRPAAQRAARKKFIISRAGDAALICAAVLLSIDFKTGDIATILAIARDGDGTPLTSAAAAFLAISALLKSAQFPTHGWLTEVMETPTPVSALLHAGVVNAGGFLLIRLADVMLHAPLVLAILVIVGGFTALFGSLVMLTQSAVKTSLAWSTVAQMGFMILQCGLALFPIALLHIIAHSLYKAHAFLSCGCAVETVSAIRRPGPVTIPTLGAVGRAFLLALFIFAVFGVIFGIVDKPPQAMALGAILIFGVAYLIAQGLADAAPRALTWRTTLYSIAAATAYFALQWISDDLLNGTLPTTPQPGPLEWTLMVLAVATFGLVALAQSLFPLWAYHPAAAGFRVHLVNGLYVNALFDRLLGGWIITRSVSPTSEFVKE